jgi:hypothetical protein
MALGFAVPAQAQQPPDCDKACLSGVMDQYLAALAAHDSRKAPLSYDVKYTENGVTLATTDGLWNTVKGAPIYKFVIADPDNRQVAMLGIISENGNQNFIAVRLMVEKHKITEIENLVVRNITGGGGGFGVKRTLTAPHPLFMEVEPADKRLSRDKLQAIANSYFTGLDTEESGKDIPFDPKCQRMENGTFTASSPDDNANAMAKLDCKAQFDTGFSTIVTNIRARRFPVIDTERGLVFALGFFDHSGAAATMGAADGTTKENTGSFAQPFSFIIAEVFKVKDGKLRQIEAVLTTVPYGMLSGW